MSTDPTCSCACDDALPLSADPAPGEPAVALRSGTHATFFARMSERLGAEQVPDGPNAGSRPLGSLSTRSTTDPAVALLDAWAATLDVLTLYQERYAQETWLRTATERRSVIELARMVSYELAPGVSAETFVAFTVDEAVGAPGSVNIVTGLAIQSVPGQDEKPQLFETDASMTARAEWNALRVQTRGAQVLDPDSTTLQLQGAALNLKPGNRLLIVGNGGVSAGTGNFALRVVLDATPDPAADRTEVKLDEKLGALTFPVTVFVFRRSTSGFGANVPDRINRLGAAVVVVTGGVLSVEGTVDIAAPDDALVPGGIALFDEPGVPKAAFTLSAVTRLNVKRFNILGQTTRLTLVDLVPAAVTHTIAGTTIWLGSEPLPLAEVDIATDVSGRRITLASGVDGLAVGQYLAIRGTVTGPSTDPDLGGTATEIARIGVLGSTVSGRTVIDIEADLDRSYDPNSVVINANVLPASHGETVPTEVLGHGDGATANQEFLLRRPPLTHRIGLTGAEPQITLRVGGVEWSPVPTLYEAKPVDRCYTVRLDDDGTVRLRFGDGLAGARLPTGVENVVAQYRTGLGTAGMVRTDQLRLLRSRPLGLKSATNPVPAAGGADPEVLDDARINAPMKVLTLDRVVSLRDHADFARTWPGIGRATADLLWVGRRQKVVVSVADVTGAVATDEVAGQLRDGIMAGRDPAAPEVEVVGFVEAWFRTVLGVYVDNAYDPETVLASVVTTVTTAFSFAERGFGQVVSTAEVVGVAHRVDGVRGVDVIWFNAVTDDGAGLVADVAAGTVVRDVTDGALAAPKAEYTNVVVGATIRLVHPQNGVLVLQRTP